MNTIFTHKQDRILFGIHRPRGAAQHPLADCLAAAESRADFFGCQIVLGEDGHPVCLLQNAGMALLSAAKSPVKPGLSPAAARELASAPKLEDLLAAAKGCSLPLALFVPAHVTAKEEDRHRLYEALDSCCRQQPDHVPLILCSSDSELLTLGARNTHMATGLVIAPWHSCDVTFLCRSCQADMCILPRELATDCRLCGLRSSGMYTMIVGDFTPRDVLYMSISGADAFMAVETAQLTRVFANR